MIWEGISLQTLVEGRKEEAWVYGVLICEGIFILTLISKISILDQINIFLFNLNY